MTLLINQSHVDLPEANNPKITNDSVQSDKNSDCSISEKETLNDELFAKCAMINGNVFQASALEHHDNVDELEQDLEEINIFEGNNKLKCNSATNNNRYNFIFYK